MNVPRLDHPERYTGLYVYDFGDHVAVGYTAEEIRILQATPEHAAGMAYRIYRAEADGRVLLRGVAGLDRPLREGLVFQCSTAPAAVADHEALLTLAAHHPPPCVVHWYRVSPIDSQWAACNVLVYDAHSTAAVGAWLNSTGFDGGELVEADTRLAERLTAEGGADAHVAIAPDPRYHARSRTEVLASTAQAIQRRL